MMRLDGTHKLPLSLHDLDAAGRNDYSGPTRHLTGQALISGRVNSAACNLTKSCNADRLLACEFEQVIGHTVVAALLVQLCHHGEVRASPRGILDLEPLI
jgi:hypothetical protein